MFGNFITFVCATTLPSATCSPGFRSVKWCTYFRPQMDKSYFAKARIMKMLTPLDPPRATSKLRSCSRCGQEFAGMPGAYVCDACRKPQPGQNDYRGKPLSSREKQ